MPVFTLPKMCNLWMFLKCKIVLCFLENVLNKGIVKMFPNLCICSYTCKYSIFTHNVDTVLYVTIIFNRDEMKAENFKDFQVASTCFSFVIDNPALKGFKTATNM